MGDRAAHFFALIPSARPGSRRTGGGSVALVAVQRCAAAEMPVFTAKCRLCGSAISAFLTHAQNLCRQFKCLRSSEFGMLLALLSMGKEKRVFRLLMNLCFDPHLGSHCETLSFQNVCELP